MYFSDLPDEGTVSPIEMTFEQFADLAKSPPSAKAKTEIKRYSPASYLTPHRSISEVDEVCMLGLDFDDVTEEAFHGVLAGPLYNFRLFFYTTWKDDPTKLDKRRYRVFIELAKPIPGELWKSLYKRFAETLGLKFDAMVAHPAAYFYGPATDGTGRYESGDWRDIFLNAVPLDIQAYCLFEGVKQESTSAAIEIPARPGAFTREDVKARYRVSWRHTTNSTTKQIVRRLHHLLKGEPWPKEVETNSRNAGVMSVCLFLLREFMSASPESCVEFFRPALAKWASESETPETEDSVRRTAIRAAEKIARTDAERAAIPLPRVSVQNKEDIEEKQNLLGDRVPIVLHETTLYFLRESGRYKAYPLRVAAGRLQQDLSWCMDTFVETDRGPRPKPINQIIGEAQVVEEIIYSTSEDNRIDHEMERLVVRACRLKPTVPVFHVDIQKIIEETFGENADAVFDYMALFRNNKNLLRAPFIYGKTGGGKGTFAAAMSQAYGRPPGTIDKSGWNGYLEYTPVVFEDEKTDLDYDDIKRLVGGGQTPLRRKYMADAVFEGNRRIILAANHFHLFGDIKGLGSDGHEALADRLLLLPAKPNNLWPTIQADVDDLIKRMPEHLAWLEINRAVPRENDVRLSSGLLSRFRGRQSKQSAASIIAQWSWSSTAVLEICYDFLTDESKKSAIAGNELIYLKEGSIFVSFDYVKKRWIDCTGRIGNERAIMPGLMAVANTDTVKVNNVPRPAWRINLVVLGEYLARTRGLTPEALGVLIANRERASVRTAN